ncbi:MAG: hypothetical protein UZ17_ACD001000098 [Acidobacteria bacterium OLB17]|nr:MAG: hypothetical protein UZ17_ACD001000098 [Acidobacteria bacterium OLB17]
MKLKTRFLNSFRGILKVPFLERPLRTLTTGKAATSVVARMVPNNYQYPAGSIREFDYHGVKLSSIYTIT